MVALQATHDIRKVSLWLGHSSTETEIYTRADPTQQLETIGAMAPAKLRKGHFRPPDKLIELLKPRPSCGDQRQPKTTGARPLSATDSP